MNGVILSVLVFLMRMFNYLRFYLVIIIVLEINKVFNYLFKISNNKFMLI